MSKDDNTAIDPHRLRDANDCDHPPLVDAMLAEAGARPHVGMRSVVG